MNMLLRLQEAANYSSTQSCDSDSTSHHDEQLDSSLESALWRGYRFFGQPSLLLFSGPNMKSFVMQDGTPSYTFIKEAGY